PARLDIRPGRTRRALHRPGNGCRLHRLTRSHPMLTHYIPLALRTNSPVTGSNPEVSPNLLHAALGLASEVLEVLLANPADTLAELGDVCWFVALAGFELGCDPFADALEGHDF